MASHDVDQEATRLAVLFREYVQPEASPAQARTPAHGVPVGGHGD